MGSLINTCQFCGKTINPSSSSVYQEVRGWERRRGQGGTNAIALRRPLQSWAHSWCIDKQKRGLTGQASLIDEEGLV